MSPSPVPVGGGLGGRAHRGGEDPGFVLILDGPSGVGTSTTLAALQTAWPGVRPGPLLDVGVEHAYAAFGAEIERWWELIEDPDHSGAGDGPRHWGPLGREVMRVVPAVAATWAVHGWDVGIAQALRDRATAGELIDALAGLPTLHVGLTCEADVLEDRARSTGDPDEAEWRAGRALAELAAFESVARRDLVLDTTESATEELVAEILEAVRARLR